jgi:hypothetical protein
MVRDVLEWHVVVRDLMVRDLLVGLCVGRGFVDGHFLVWDVLEWHVVVRDLLVRFVVVRAQLGPSRDAVRRGTQS